MTTDKTTGLSYETKDNYRLAATSQLKDDKVLVYKTRKNFEVNYNAIGKGALRFLKVGQSRKHDNRKV